MREEYYFKYLKYKNKYLELQKQIGGKCERELKITCDKKNEKLDNPYYMDDKTYNTYITHLIVYIRNYNDDHKKKVIEYIKNKLNNKQIINIDNIININKDISNNKTIEIDNVSQLIKILEFNQNQIQKLKALIGTYKTNNRDQEEIIEAIDEYYKDSDKDKEAKIDFFTYVLFINKRNITLHNNTQFNTLITSANNTTLTNFKAFLEKLLKIKKVNFEEIYNCVIDKEYNFNENNSKKLMRLLEIITDTNFDINLISQIISNNIDEEYFIDSFNKIIEKYPGKQIYIAEFIIKNFNKKAEIIDKFKEFIEKNGSIIPIDKISTISDPHRTSNNSILPVDAYVTDIFNLVIKYPKLDLLDIKFKKIFTSYGKDKKTITEIINTIEQYNTDDTLLDTIYKVYNIFANTSRGMELNKTVKLENVIQEKQKNNAIKFIDIFDRLSAKK